MASDNVKKEAILRIIMSSPPPLPEDSSGRVDDDMLGGCLRGGSLYFVAAALSLIIACDSYNDADGLWVRRVIPPE